MHACVAISFDLFIISQPARHLHGVLHPSVPKVSSSVMTSLPSNERNILGKSHHLPISEAKRCTDQTSASYQIEQGKANYSDNNLSELQSVWLRIHSKHQERKSKQQVWNVCVIHRAGSCVTAISSTKRLLPHLIDPAYFRTMLILFCNTTITQAWTGISMTWKVFYFYFIFLGQFFKTMHFYLFPLYLSRGQKPIRWRRSQWENSRRPVWSHQTCYKSSD